MFCVNMVKIARCTSFVSLFTYFNTGSGIQNDYSEKALRNPVAICVCPPQVRLFNWYVRRREALSSCEMEKSSWLKREISDYGRRISSGPPKLFSSRSDPFLIKISLALYLPVFFSRFLSPILLPFREQSTNYRRERGAPDAHNSDKWISTGDGSDWPLPETVRWRHL